MKMRSIFILLSVYVAVLVMAAASSARHGHGHAYGHAHGHGHGHGIGIDLKINFYHQTCADVESIVKNITQLRVAADDTLPAKLLRLHYHDCFVRGCDASILLDPVAGGEAVEKEARPNLSIGGYEVIDEIKAKLEQECPQKVSCADIVALAARDAVSYQFGRSMWAVPMGRRDGKISKSTEASVNLPSASANYTTLHTQFESLGLDTADLVALSGAHTIGVARCGVISRRLFNFTGKGDTDPSLNSTYAEETLKKQCTSNAITVEMDPTSSKHFDSHYFEALKQNKGLFQSDAALLTNTDSARIARKFEDGDSFLAQFGESMIKMGAIGVLTEQNGEIRKKCRFVN